MQKSIFLQKILDSRILAVVRADSPQQAFQIVEALVTGGIKSIELTYSVPQAHQVIADLVEKYQGTDIVIGAGTVLEPTSARLALISGAQFIVSPAFNPKVAKLCNLYQIPYIPGVFTPREVQEALSYGSEVLKLFPGDLASPKMIKALKGPFPYLDLLPSGGVNVDNLFDWFKAGAVAVSAGTSVTAPAFTGDYETVTQNAQALVAAVKEIKAKGVST